MNFDTLTPDKIGLTIALMIAVVSLWRFSVAGLKKRDEDRAEVVNAYKLLADQAEENQRRMESVIAEFNRLTKELFERADKKGR